MANRFRVMTLWLGLSCAVVGSSARGEELAGERLFNGRDLTGWYSWLVDSRREDPRGVFGVEQGELRISGEGLGYLATEGTYQDYELTVEYRWGDSNWGDRAGKARDAGLFLHGTGPDGNSMDGGGAFMAAVECQVMEGATGDLMLIRGRDSDGRDLPLRLSSTVGRARDEEGWPTFDPQGRSESLARWGRINRLGKRSDWRDELGQGDPSGAERPVGEWNRVVCRAERDTLTVWLNGRPVNRATGVWPSSGRILLQSEGAEIFFRRVELKRLASASEPESIPAVGGP